MASFSDNLCAFIFIRIRGIYYVHLMLLDLVGMFIIQNTSHSQLQWSITYGYLAEE
jgi:hypothetical protein